MGYLANVAPARFAPFAKDVLSMQLSYWQSLRVKDRLACIWLCGEASARKEGSAYSDPHVSTMLPNSKYGKVTGTSEVHGSFLLSFGTLVTNCAQDARAPLIVSAAASRPK